MKHVISHKIFAILLLHILLFSCKNDKNQTTATQNMENQKPLSELLAKTTPISIKIDKSDYKLMVYTSDTLVKSYPVVFGFNAVDDKQKEGDGKTPEGTFKIRDKYPHNKWNKFIWIDYPNETSWKKFNQLKSEGVIKEGETIGGEIGIHGVPEGRDALIENRINWTLGCIALKNNDVDEIYPYITTTTKIEIIK